MNFHRLFLGSTFILFVVFSGFRSYSQTSNWEGKLKADMDAFLKCEAQDEKKACQQFIGKSLNTVYGFNDFDSNGRYLSVAEISNFLKTNDKWKQLGHGYEQEALTKAQELANNNKPAVAIYLGESGIGHMVLILPGELTNSGSWGLKVPNSASFFSSQPSQSYLNKGISYAFKKNHIKDILIYGRTL